MDRHDRFWFRVSLITLLCLFVLAVLSLTSCRTQREAQTERTEYVHLTDTLREVRTRIDSVVIKDSVVTIIKGDTVRIERWRDRWHRSADTVTVERWKVKTVYRTKTVTKTREVEKPLAWWQRTLMWLGGLSALGMLLTVWLALRKVKR